jgi:carbon storage regulator
MLELAWKRPRRKTLGARRSGDRKFLVAGGGRPEVFAFGSTGLVSLGHRPLSKGPVMLVISRRLGDGIVIDRTVHISVIKLGKGRIRLGITAPPSVRIHRSEELPPVLEEPDGIESLGGSSSVVNLKIFSTPNAVPGLVSCQEGDNGR